MDDLLNFFQTTAGNVITAATAAKYSQPYELEKLRLQAEIANGGLTRDMSGPGYTASVASVSPLLLIGGLGLALVAVVLLVKD